MRHTIPKVNAAEWQARKAQAAKDKAELATLKADVADLKKPKPGK